MRGGRSRSFAGSCTSPGSTVRKILRSGETPFGKCRTEPAGVMPPVGSPEASAARPLLRPASSIAAMTSRIAVWCTMCPEPGTEWKVLCPTSRCSCPDCRSVSVRRSSSPAMMTTGMVQLTVLRAHRERVRDHQGRFRRTRAELRGAKRKSCRKAVGEFLRDFRRSEDLPHQGRPNDAAEERHQRVAKDVAEERIAAGVSDASVRRRAAARGRLLPERRERGGEANAAAYGAVRCLDLALRQDGHLTRLDARDERNHLSPREVSPAAEARRRHFSGKRWAMAVETFRNLAK